MPSSISSKKGYKKIHAQLPKKQGKKTKEHFISNTNRKTGMLTTNPLVQIPLSLLAIASAQGLSVWCMQEAVVIQRRLSMKQGQHYSNHHSMPKNQSSPQPCVPRCTSRSLLQMRGVPLSTAQAAAMGSRASENLPGVHQLTVRCLCFPAANRIVTLNPGFQEMPSMMTAFKKKIH